MKKINDNVYDRMKTLVDTLNEANNAYYNEDKEIMSNYEYDKLYDELLKLEIEILLTSIPIYLLFWQL